MHVLTEGWTFLESPRWHAGRFWCSDFYTGSVIAVDMDGHTETVAHVPEQPSGLGWLPDGDLLVVSMRDRKVLRLHDGVLREHADLSSVATGHANDMVVSDDGYAYVGNFGFDLMRGERPRPAVLAGVGVDGTVRAAARDMMFPNGAVISADGTTLIVAETFARRLTAFTIRAGGALSERRVWAALDRVAPDGLALDAQGCIWVADATHRRAVRVREGGEILDEIAHEDAGIYACALGGDDGRTLALCAAPSYEERVATASREAKLLALTVDVPGAGLR
jgi:sugar lactone lactonase YvrE